MDRKVAEKKIQEKLLEIYDIMKEYTKDNYLSLCIRGPENDDDENFGVWMSFNNTYWEHPDSEVLNKSFCLEESGTSDYCS